MSVNHLKYLYFDYILHDILNYKTCGKYHNINKDISQYKHIPSDFYVTIIFLENILANVKEK